MRRRIKWGNVETFIWFLLSSFGTIYYLCNFINGINLLQFMFMMFCIGIFINTYDEIKKAFAGTNANK